MPAYTLHREQRIPKPLAVAFSFFEKPENLAVITPPSLHFKMLTPSPIVMKKGARIEHSIRLMGITLKWTSLITEYDPPHRFVDIQLRGPYRKWIHIHTFKEENGVTLMTDDVSYSLSFGPFGALANRLYVRRSVESIFDYRNRVIADLMTR